MRARLVLVAGLLASCAQPAPPGDGVRGGLPTSADLATEAPDLDGPAPADLALRDAPAGSPDLAGGDLAPAPPVTLSFQNGVAPSASYAGARDTYLAEAQPDANHGGALTVNADGADPNFSDDDLVALLAWDISAIPPGKTVTAASLTVWIVDHPGGQAYSIHALKRAWREDEATWNRPAAGASWGSPGAAASSDRDGTALATLTAMSAGAALTVPLNAAGLAWLQDFVDHPDHNHGFILVGATNTNGLDLASSEDDTPAHRPRLTVTFR
jgi:hypothetical protein